MYFSFHVNYFSILMYLFLLTVPTNFDEKLLCILISGSVFTSLFHVPPSFLTSPVAILCIHTFHLSGPWLLHLLLWLNEMLGVAYLGIASSYIFHLKCCHFKLSLIKPYWEQCLCSIQSPRSSVSAIFLNLHVFVIFWNFDFIEPSHL